MKRFVEFAAIVAVIVAVAGCSRKPPQKFVPDDPAPAIPALRTGPAVAQAADSPAADTFSIVPEGTWKLSIDRQVFMRSTSMATTTVKSTTDLTMKVTDSTAASCSVSITDAESTFVALEPRDNIQEDVAATYRGLTFTIEPGVDGLVMIRPKDGRQVPEELSEALALMIPPFNPALMRPSESRAASRSVFPGLPGGRDDGGVLSGQWKLDDGAGGRGVLALDFSAAVKGEATIESIHGRVTGGERRGRSLCAFGPTGLTGAGMAESGVYSVELKPRKGKTRLLEQKVTVRASLGPA